VRAQIFFLSYQRCLKNPLENFLMALLKGLLHGGRWINGAEACVLVDVRGNVAERSKVGQP